MSKAIEVAVKLAAAKAATDGEVARLRALVGAELQAALAASAGQKRATAVAKGSGVRFEITVSQANGVNSWLTVDGWDFSFPLVGVDIPTTTVRLEEVASWLATLEVASFGYTLR